MTEPLELLDRRDLADLLKCSYCTARKVFKNIKATIPKKALKPEHKKRLPAAYVQKYLHPVTETGAAK